MKKFKFFFDFEKEEQWLQKMAAEGWSLKSVLFTYTFEKTAPDTAPIRLDYHAFYSSSRYLDYLTLYEDCGWKHIAGNKSCGMHYFKQTRPDASSEIFSDAASMAGRYKRAADMWLALFACYLADCAALFTPLYSGSTGNQFLHYLLNPKSAFLTPGIWSLKGHEFITAFLFESPFAFTRICAPFILLALIITYGIFSIAFLRQYRKCKDSSIVR